MKLSNLQKVLWVLAGAAAFVFIWLLMWADYRADLAQAETEPPFFAQFELTDHRGMVQTDEDFAQMRSSSVECSHCGALGELCSMLTDDFAAQSLCLKAQGWTKSRGLKQWRCNECTNSHCMTRPRPDLADLRCGSHHSDGAADAPQCPMCWEPFSLK